MVQNPNTLKDNMQRQPIPDEIAQARIQEYEQIVAQKEIKQISETPISPIAAERNNTVRDIARVNSWPYTRRK